MTLHIPLFPLKLVLFPGGVLPLSIFEKRYVDMVRNCLRNNTGFGIVATLSGGINQSLPFAEIGVLVEISETNVTQPGLFNLRCLATQKFSVQSASQQEDGLWLGHVELLPSEPAVLLPKDIIAPRVYFEQLIKSLEQEAHAEASSSFQQPYQLENATWLANRWCEILAIPLDKKQSLLALDDPLSRLMLVNEMLTK